MIEIKNLSKSFGDAVVWANVSLTIPHGETLAVIGKSGCGKSVLLKHIVALLQPDEGEVIVDGTRIQDLSYLELRRLRQRFGVLFQGAALFDSITSFENVAFPLRFFTKKTESEIKQDVMQALEMVALADKGDKFPSELSGGMKKRVGLARAIVMKPDYLLYDEPTSGLDPETSEEINALIIQMAGSLDITSIVISHDMHSVLKVAHKAAFLDEQKLSWYGAVQDLHTATHERLLSFVKASEYYIGEPKSGVHT